MVMATIVSISTLANSHAIQHGADDVSLEWGKPMVFAGKSTISSQNDSLSILGRHYGTDKAASHHYTPMYHQVFGPARSSIRRFLEVGVFQGASIRMWADWFPNAEIIGVDHFDCGKGTYSSCTPPEFYNSWKNGQESKRVTLVNASEGHPSMEAFASEQQQHAQPFDLIIEDGSHTQRDQQVRVHA